MFTGLVSALGTIENIQHRGGDAVLSVALSPMFTNVQRGESIAVNGVCLTVETFSSIGFSAFASAETLAVSNLSALRTGSRVNLERALALGDRLGGHLVSGHVDGLGQVESVVDKGRSKIFRILLPAFYSRQVLPKGSITLDGISLTVTHCGSGFLEVNIIPETQQATTIKDWKPGYRVNFETDLIGKYVQNFLTPPEHSTGEAPQQKSTLTIDFLRENGF